MNNAVLILEIVYYSFLPSLVILELFVVFLTELSRGTGA